MVRYLLILLLYSGSWPIRAFAQQAGRRLGQRSRPVATNPVVLKPARVWDGLSAETHDGWIVVVRGSNDRGGRAGRRR